MTSSDPAERGPRGDSRLAFSIMFFAMALLFFMLGWANGVRHQTTFLHIPQTGSWLIATAITLGLGVAFFVWSRAAKRS